jgi:DNA-binding NtrC family response regulator
MDRPRTRILLVEDEADCRRVLLRAIRRWPDVEVEGVGSEREARRALARWTPHVLLLDLHLGEEGGSGLAVAEHCASLEPAPVIVALSGLADRTETFRLAQLGARAYLDKPFRPRELREAVRAALEEAPDLEPLLRASVGRRPLKEVVRTARTVMTRQAVAQAGGNRTSAARMLDVTRQNVQAVLRKTGEAES